MNVCATLNVFAYAYTMFRYLDLFVCIALGTQLWVCMYMQLTVTLKHGFVCSLCDCEWKCVGGCLSVDPSGFKRSPSFPCSPSLVEAGWGKLSHEASARAKGSPQQIKMQFSAPPCTEARDSLHVMDSPHFLYCTGPLCYSSLTVSSAFMLPIFLCSILTSQLMGPIQ